jgi:hypothetical protein
VVPAPEDFKKALVQAGMPEGFAQMFLSFELEIKGGEIEPVTQADKELPGYSPVRYPKCKGKVAIASGFSC